MTRHLVFIDGRVADYRTLVATLAADTEWVLIEAGTDGLFQMQAALARYAGLDSIQIVSHGSSGSLQLGATVLHAGNIAEHETQLAAIGAALADDGDILLYGCNVAQGEAGQAFIAALSEATGADVAASTDATGAASLGGDMILEAQAGSIEATMSVDAHAAETGQLLLESWTGTAGDDTYTGGVDNDIILGGAGYDTLNGSGGNDWIDGGDEVASPWPVDDLDGGPGDDTILGGTGNDWITGGPGNDSIDAGADNDIIWLTIGEGNDTIFAGTGNDTLTGYATDLYVSRTVTADMGDGDDRIEVAVNERHGSNATLIVTGGAGTDTYVPDGFYPYDLVITDFAAGDVVDLTALLDYSASGGLGYPGGNPFVAGPGYMTLVQNGANVELRYDADGAAGTAYSLRTAITFQNLTLGTLTAANFGGIPPDGSNVPGTTWTGTTGDDTHTGGFFDDTILGGDGYDTLDGSGGNDRIEGGDEPVSTWPTDDLDGGPGDDTILGGTGNDWITGGPGNDSIDAGADNDTVQLSIGEGNDTIFAGTGNDTLTGYATDLYVARTVTADMGDGNDVIEVAINDQYGSTASLVVTGGTGVDTYIPDDFKPYGLVIADFACGEGGDLIDVEKLLNYSAVSGRGYSGGSPFRADLGYLRLVQNGSNAELQYDPDGINGSTDAFRTAITFLGINKDSITSDNFVGKLIIGTEDADTLVGGWANDTIKGLGGSDIIDGGEGADQMEGGSGADTYYIDDFLDAVFEADNLPEGSSGFRLEIDLGTTIDTVVASINYTLGNYVEYLTLAAGSTAASGTGNALDNRLSGNAGDNVLEGKGGTDTLEGGGGTDMAVFSGNRADYAIAQLADGYTVTDNVSSRDGVDTLTSIERLQFADRSINLGSNNAPTGTVTISGTATQGQTLTAGHTLADEDGLGTVSYQWRADGTEIADATSSSFTLTQAEVGKTITVEARYTDNGNTAESVSSSSTAAIANSNDSPTVANALADQSATEDSAFSFAVPANAFADVDAGDSLSYSATQSDGTALPTWLAFNTTTRTFSGTPTNSDVGSLTIRVTARDGGNASTYDDFILTVNAVNDPHTGEVGAGGTAQEDQTLTVSDTLADIDGLGTRSYSWQASSDGTQWNDIGSGASLTLEDAHVGQQIRVVASYTDGQGFAETATSTATDAVLGHQTGTTANDHLIGTRHADLLEGGAGNDFYRVDHAGDSVIEVDGGGIDFVSARIDYALPDHVENLLLNASVTFRGPRSGFFGGPRNVRIDLGIDGTGNDGDNLIVGNRAANRLAGRAGDDTLVGGAGADAFVFDVSDGGIDRIADFGAGDLIEVVGSGTVSYDAATRVLSLGDTPFAVLNGWSGFVAPVV